MTPEQRAAARERCDKATAGPWSNVDTRQWAYPCVFVGAVPAGETYTIGKHRHVADLACTVGKLENEIANADFIAHARTDLPAALDEIDRLEKLNAELTGKLNEAIAQRDRLRPMLQTDEEPLGEATLNPSYTGDE